MALPKTNAEFECMICDEVIQGLEAAREHALDQHAQDIVQEEWGHYFNEA